MSAAALAPDVAAQLIELVDITDEAIKSAKASEEKVVALQTELTALKAAGLDKPAPQVTLQKVAFDNLAVRRTVQALVDRSILPAEDFEKTANLLKDEPSFALDLLDRVASFHEFPSAPVGRGIPKSANSKNLAASRKDSDPDGWGRVTTEGA